MIFQRVASKRSTVQSLRGFSLGESLLAMFVLSVGMLSIVALFQATLRNSFEIRDGIVASQLAQEGLELVRNTRDNNFAAGGDGFTGTPTTGFDASGKQCLASYEENEIHCYASQNSLTNKNLLYSGGSPFYQLSTTTTRFVRYIYVDYDNSAKTAHVKSFIIWDGRSLPPPNGSVAGCSLANQCVYAEAVLTSWLKP